MKVRVAMLMSQDTAGMFLTKEEREAVKGIGIIAKTYDWPTCPRKGDFLVIFEQRTKVTCVEHCFTKGWVEVDCHPTFSEIACAMAADSSDWEMLDVMDEAETFLRKKAQEIREKEPDSFTKK